MLPKKTLIKGKRIASDKQIVKARKRVKKALYAYTLSPDEQNSKKLQKEKRKLNAQYPTVESEELSDEVW